MMKVKWKIQDKEDEGMDENGGTASLKVAKLKQSSGVIEDTEDTVKRQKEEESHTMKIRAKKKNNLLTVPTLPIMC